VERPIQGPEPYQPRYTSQEAGLFIRGIGHQLFDKLMAQHLPTIRPVWVGKDKLWRWMDIAILNYILDMAETAPPAKMAGKKKDGQDEEENS
jgi:hypothetical protein